MRTVLQDILSLTLARFVRAREGSVVIIFALTLPVMIMAVGGAIDFARTANVDARIQNALDSAVLAATKELSDGSIDERDVDDVAQRYFEANLDALVGGGPNVTASNLNFKIDRAANIVEATVDAAVETSFLKVAGFDSITTSAVSSALYNPLTIELSLVLDVTGSMEGQKLRDLKTAAKSLVNQLLPENQPARREKVRIAIVPYANGVNVGRSTSNQRNRLEKITGDAHGSSCVVERAESDGRYAFSDDGPDIDRDPESRIPTFDDFPDHDRANFCPSAEVVWLTNDAKTLNEEIDDFEARGWTAGHIGIGWGWYTLSPLWNDIQPGGSNARPYRTKDLLKVMVIMTDGKFNTQFQRDNGASAQQARNLCRNIEDEKVRIYTVAFKAPGSAEQMLRDCASEDGRYFETSTGTELSAAFLEIAQEIARLRLSS